MISIILFFPWSLLFFSPPLLTPASSSSVRVDRSLSSLLLDASNLPPPHPGLSVVLSRQLIGAGFHRTLLTKVEQVSYHHHHIIADHSVLRVAIMENITCDMYVDIDQVKN